MCRRDAADTAEARGDRGLQRAAHRGIGSSAAHQHPHPRPSAAARPTDRPAGRATARDGTRAAPTPLCCRAPARGVPREAPRSAAQAQPRARSRHPHALALCTRAPMPAPRPRTRRQPPLRRRRSATARCRAIGRGTRRKHHDPALGTPRRPSARGRSLLRERRPEGRIQFPCAQGCARRIDNAPPTQRGVEGCAGSGPEHLATTRAKTPRQEPKHIRSALRSTAHPRHRPPTATLLRAGRATDHPQ